VIDGTYGFVYCSTEGLGIGVFTVRGETFLDVDATGVQYNGIAAERDDGSIAVEVTLAAPPMSAVVEGAEIVSSRRIEAVFPAAFGDGEPQIVAASPVTIKIMVKRLRDCFLIEGAKPIIADAFKLAATSDVYFK
jgi:hypothetical protein